VSADQIGGQEALGAFMIRALLAATISALTAACAWFGLAIQLHLLIESFAQEGRNIGDAVWRFFAYFTLLTNLLVALTTTAWIIRRPPPARVLATAAVNILLVGAVYHALLASRWDPQGLQLVGDRLLHTATPVLFTLFWLFVIPRRMLEWRDALYMLAYPMLYLAYLQIRSALDGFHPYWFVDLPALGPIRTAANAAALLALFGAASVGAVALDRSLPQRR
jgi:hypothetical protein